MSQSGGAPDELGESELETHTDSSGVVLPSLPGSLVEVGGYRILGELARGAMGVVFRARHAELTRDVAVKVLAAGNKATERQLERFRTEGRAAAQVVHPNVVAVHDLGRDGDLAYLVMDLVEGRSLEDVVSAEGPLEPREAARITQRLALALAHAHERSVLHRDVKPANVLITADREPKLTDFGLAKLLDADGERLTKTGQLLGTPSFMSPEQAAGGGAHADARTDVYSLGATLYYMLTGRPPFEASALMALVTAITARPPVPPRKLRRSIPADLEAICLRCLRKRPKDRYADGAELAEDLARFLEGQPVVRPRRRAMGALGGLGVFAFAVVGAVLAGGDGERAAAEASPVEEVVAPASEEPEAETPAVASAGRAPWPHDQPKEDAAVARALYVKTRDRSLSDGEWFERVRRASVAGSDEAWRSLGQAYLHGRGVDMNIGRGLQCLRRALRFGNPRAAGDLAVVHGGSDDYWGFDERAHALGVGQDLALAAALGFIAGLDENEKKAKRALQQLKELEDLVGPGPKTAKEAFAVVQAAYEPPQLGAALWEGRQALLRAQEALPEQRRRELAALRDVYRTDFEGAHAVAMELKDPRERLVFLAHPRSNLHPPSKLRYGLALLRGEGVDRAPLAGVFDLFEAAEAGLPRAALELMKLYREGAPGVVEVDLEAAGAWLFLARELGAKAPMVFEYFQSAEKLPVPAEPREAWRMAREALPWSG